MGLTYVDRWVSAEGYAATMTDPRVQEVFAATGINYDAQVYEIVDSAP